MKKLQQGLMLFAAMTGIILPSCSDDSPWSGSDTEGGIVLSLEPDGRLMRQGTRADDTTCPIVPDGNAFGVSLYKTDNSYSKTWKSLEAFNSEKGFPIGDYKIEAAYGDIDTEGFELPCFKGVNDVHVAPGTTTDVQVVATLANAMVSVRYTDTFRNLFPHYSASVQTPGHDWLVFAQDETRPGFIDPGDEGMAKVAVTMTNAAGKTVTVEPASFKPQARRHYVITVNATGNVSTGDLALDIQFDEEVVFEKVTISLGDDLFNSPAPEIRAKDFTDGDEISLLEYDAISTNPQFDLFAFGGFREVNLNVISDGTYAPSFGRSVQLVGATPLIQTLLAGEGVEVSGLFKNADKMAVVNVKKFIEQLPAGSYTVQLQAQDAMTRLSEPVTIKATVGKVDFTLSKGADIAYHATEVYVDVASNSEQIKNKIQFKLPDSNNRPVAAEIKSVSPVTTGSGELQYVYRFCLLASPVSNPTLDVEADYGRIKRTEKFAVSEPQYTVDVDAFARFAVLRINADADLREYVVKNLQIFNDKAQVTPGNISRDLDNGFITVRGLSAASQYSALKGKLGSFEKAFGSFTTEPETDVTNGNFSQLGTALTTDWLQVGGQYHVGLFDYYNRSKVNRPQAAGWATVNAFTCYTGSTTKNTWFMVPSTWVDNGTAVIRSVGYHHAGTEPKKSGSFGNRNYYCENAPTQAQLNKRAGELFLGSYSFNGSETRSEGTAFGSRPMSVAFDYSYVPKAGEQGEAVVKVIDASGAVIASTSKNLSASSEMKNVKVEIPSYQFGKKAAKLYICFRSTKEGTTPSVDIPSGSALKEKGVGLNTDYYWSLSDNDYHALATGSVLTVDNVKLGYSEPVKVTPASSKRRR